uniref:Uncharacterized protein n=1 Tax=Romanomermis culicivorax TaxID=13658 RepID=A0A915K2A9_ROMCU
MPPWLRA